MLRRSPVVFVGASLLVCLASCGHASGGPSASRGQASEMLASVNGDPPDGDAGDDGDDDAGDSADAAIPGDGATGADAAPSEAGDATGVVDAPADAVRAEAGKDAGSHRGEPDAGSTPEAGDDDDAPSDLPPRDAGPDHVTAHLDASASDGPGGPQAFNAGAANASGCDVATGGAGAWGPDALSFGLGVALFAIVSVAGRKRRHLP